MSDKRLIQNENKYLKTDDDKLLLGDPNAVGKDLGEHRHFIMRNDKLLFNGGKPLAFSDTVSSVMNENSWATIKRVVKAGRALDFWDYGDYKVCYRHEKDKYGNITGDIKPFRLHLAGLYNNRAVFCSNIDVDNITSVIDTDDYVTVEKPEEYQTTQETQYYQSRGLYSYFGTQFGVSSARQSRSFDVKGDFVPSILYQFLNNEWKDILGLSVNLSDTIPASSTTATIHSEIWEDQYQNAVYPMRDAKMGNGIYTKQCYLQLPSAYEVSGNELYKETRLIREFFLGNEMLKELFGKFASVPNITEHKLQLFQYPSKAVAILDGEIAGSSSSYFILRTPFDTTKFYRLRVTNEPSVSVDMVDSTSAGRFLYTLTI